VDAGQTPRGLERFLTLAAETPDVLPLQVGLAMLQRADGRPALAETTLRGVLQQEPTSRDAMEALYDLLLAGERLPEAVPLLERALEMNPSSADHHRWLGRIATYRGHTSEATMHFVRATQVAPEQLGPLLDLARALARSGRLPEARQLLVTASERFPREPLGPERLGRLLLASGDAAAAWEAFQEAERRGMRTAELFGALGSLAARLNRAEDARRYYQRSLDLQPDQPRLQQELQALRAEN
jgi:Flp pilus assembly protein TadD